MSIRRDVADWLQRVEDSDEYRESLDIVENPSSLDGPNVKDEDRRDYIRAMRDIATADVRHAVAAPAATGVIVMLALANIPWAVLVALPSPARASLFIGLASLAFSGALAFFYARRVHITRMRMTRCIPTIDVQRVRELWAGKAGVGQRYGRTVQASQIALAVAVLGCGYTFVVALTLGEPTPAGP